MCIRDSFDFAHFARLVIVHRRQVFRAEALLESELDGSRLGGLVGGAEQALHAGDIGARGLFAIDVFAGRDGRFEMFGMQIDGRGDEHRVDVRLREQFMVVLIDACALRPGNLGLGVVDAVRGDVADGREFRALDVGHVGADPGVSVGTHMAHVKGTKLAAICDIYPDRIDNAKTKIPGAQSARVYKDYHELLAQPDVDAVLITTPVYLHPEHFEAAVPSGKHIYCEKPAGADVAGVKRLLRASDKAAKSRTIQFGFQQRFSPEYLTAMDYYKSGNCLLYTSDAADDLTRVDIGGRRIIK